ncbi:hypothetical protein GGI35DRAFT_329927 [Trichoderma velutinum]
MPAAEEGWCIVGSLVRTDDAPRCASDYSVGGLEIRGYERLDTEIWEQTKSYSTRTVQLVSRIKLVPRADPVQLFGRCQPKTKIYTLQTLRPASPQGDGWLGPQVERWPPRSFIRCRARIKWAQGQQASS